MTTGKMFIKFQVSLGTTKTLSTNACFERESALNGVKMKNHHTDNGVFTAREFIAHMHDSDQCITFSGVGAHHQNDISEIAVGTVTRKARTQLKHAQLRWSEQTPTGVWPMSLHPAFQLLDMLPHMDTCMSPDESFSRTISAHENFLRLVP